MAASILATSVDTLAPYAIREFIIGYLFEVYVDQPAVSQTREIITLYWPAFRDSRTDKVVFQFIHDQGFYNPIKYPANILSFKFILAHVSAATIRAIVGIEVLNKTSEEYWFLMKFDLSYLDGNVDLGDVVVVVYNTILTFKRHNFTDQQVS